MNRIITALEGQWHRYSWLSLLCFVLAVVILHPVMDKDVPNAFGPDVRRSWRTYAALALIVMLNVIETKWSGA